MFREAGAATVSVLSAVIGLAIVAVLVSKNAQTPTVITSAGSSLAGVIGAAVAPVTGGNSLGNSFGSGLSSFGGFNLGGLTNPLGSLGL